MRSLPIWLKKDKNLVILGLVLPGGFAILSYLLGRWFSKKFLKPKYF